MVQPRPELNARHPSCCPVVAMNDVRWRKKDEPASDERNQNDSRDGSDIPGDTGAADIVGRTGEEMPEVAHDGGQGQDDSPDDATVT